MSPFDKRENAQSIKIQRKTKSEKFVAFSHLIFHFFFMLIHNTLYMIIHSPLKHRKNYKNFGVCIYTDILIEGK